MEQLGIEPGAELAGLHQAMLIHDRALDAPSVTPTPTISDRRKRLPAPPNRTIGREGELAAVGEPGTTADRGLDKLTSTPDGTVLQLSTGVHLKVNGIYYEIGLRKILFSGDPNDPSSTVLYFEQHGRFGDDASAAICPLFG